MYFFQMDQATTLGGERKSHGTKSDLSLIHVSKSFTYISLLNLQSDIIVIFCYYYDVAINKTEAQIN